jgi:lipopolysaccharide/colanic/teichoic acid biosynthesis glycosyltransferase
MASRFYASFGKRCFDLTLTIPAIMVTAPLLAGIAVAIRASMGSPVFFRQSRPGRDLRPFDILKFRTMRPLRPGETDGLADAVRLTRVGRLLRKTSLDELPQLLNVLRGDMSLVGPRPLLHRYVPYFTDEEMSRQTVPPGITGWAQVNGRNRASWDQRLAYDVWYVKHLSFILDLKVLLRTAAAILPGRQVVLDQRSIMLNLDEERANRRQR